MSDGLTVRRAVVADAEAISGVNSRAWLHAYFDIVEPRRMFKRMEDVTQTQQWATRLASPVGEIWCAEVGGVVAGYVAVGPSEDADGNPGTGALWSLDLDPSAQGAGLGSRLHDHALVLLEAAGFTRATLWVLVDNGLARRFYEGRGWIEDPSGEGLQDPAWMGPAVRYRREL